VALRWSSSPDARRILDFDIECVAAGYADPEWVPSHITAIAWSWVDEALRKEVVLEVVSGAPVE
jgi:hypothetical protein